MNENMNPNMNTNSRPPYPQQPQQPFAQPQWPTQPQRPVELPQMQLPPRIPQSQPQWPQQPVQPQRPIQPQQPQRPVQPQPPVQSQQPQPPETDGRKFRTTLMCTIIAACFCAFLVVFQILFLLTPDKSVSESENRMLQKHPKLTFSALFDGSYMKSFETYLTDQFPGRDRFVSLKSSLSELTGSRRQQNVYRAKNGRLLEEQTPVDDELLTGTLSAVNAFAADNPALKTAFLLSPNATCFFGNQLPYGLKQAAQTDILNDCAEQLDGVTWIDAYAALDAEDDPGSLFYRTDHHWTTRAAFACFKALNKQWKLGAKAKDYVFYPVTDAFSGTLASAYGDRKLRDTIEICVPKKSGGTYIVDYTSQGKKVGTLFDDTKLDQRNQYEVFLGGNFDKIVITTTAETENTLLLFKDSYANCLIPMLTPYFSTIVVVDPRYFNGNLADVLGENDFTHVLFLYNLNTFLADTSLAPMLRTAVAVPAASSAPQEDAQPAEDNDA